MKRKSISRRPHRDSRRGKCRCEALESRLLLSTDTWTSASGGSWSTAADWSTGAVPNASESVVIDQPGNIEVTLSSAAAVNSLSITGDTLEISGGTLSLAAASTIGSSASVVLSNSSLTTAAGEELSNSGSITVDAGSQLNVGGTLSQLFTGTLTLAAATPGTGVATNQLTNAGFESPAAAGSTTTSPNGWNNWGTSYVSTQYAIAGTQSMVASGPNSGGEQSFPATPGVSYTASVYAMTPSNAKLTGPEGAFLDILFYDSSGNQINSYSAPYALTLLSSTSATGGPIAGSVGNQGWNFYSTTVIAPSNAATVAFDLDTGAYTGNSGTAGGSVYWDDAEFGPTAVVSAAASAQSIANGGSITIGAGDTLNITGNFSQTAVGSLDVQLGGPPGGETLGSLSAGGTAILAGTLTATTVNGYSPSVNDGFSVLQFAAETGTFSKFQLPSASSYAFEPAVNPTYVGISAVPTLLATSVNTGTTLGVVSTNLLGVNLAYWDDQLTTTQTQQMVEAAGLNIFRFPGGSASDDYHFNMAANDGDPAANTIPEFAEMIQSVGGTGIVTIDYDSGSPQEAEAELAYLEGSPSDTTVIGNGIEWNDSTGQWQTVNWQTVGYWASLRAAAPLAQDDGLNFLRADHPAPFPGITDWEIGNEEYGSWETDHHGTALPNGTSTGAQHDPATYAAFAASFAAFAAADKNLPAIQIGIDSEDPTGAEDDDWTKNVLTDGLKDGFVPGFISDHSYMQAPGSESDSFLLNDTVTDSASLLDWSTRYADYQSLLQQVLGSQASSVQVMATEFNSVYSNPGKQTTSLVNGLFIADSIGSLLNSGYSGALVWDLRNGWDTGENNSPSLYGWREGGDYGLLGDPNDNDPPSTGPYVPYPSYFAEQLASEIIRSGGTIVSAVSNYSEFSSYAVLEANGDLDLLVINKNPDASLTEQFNLSGFTASGAAEIWQYGETQDYAQSLSTTGSSSLANFNTTLTLGGGGFSDSFPAYSMTVIQLTPAIPTDVWTGAQSNLWNNPANWSDGAVPGSTTHVVINNGTVLANSSITIGGLLISGGALDLGDNKLFLDYGSSADPIATIQSYIETGFSGGSWNGSGITSSAVAAANAAGGYYGVGYADGADGIVSGLSSGQIEVMPTLLGDAKLTGAVSFGDFQLLSQYFGSSGGWDEGNWNYASVINFGDFQLLTQNFGQTTSLSAAARTGAASAFSALPAAIDFSSLSGAESVEDLLGSADNLS
jgi:alpha-L-arabinofuranosidase